MKFGNRLRPNNGKWLLLAILLIESLSMYIPKVYAVNFAPVQQKSCASSSTCAFASNTVSSDILITTIGTFATSGSITVNSVTDSRCSSWTSQNSVSFNSGGSTFYQDWIYSCTSNSSGADTVTVTTTGTIGTIDVGIYELPSSASATKISGSTGTCGTCTGMNTASSNAYVAATQIAISMATAQSNCYTAGTGYTLASANSVGSQYSTGASSPTNYPITCSGNFFQSEAGAIFGYTASASTFKCQIKTDINSPTETVTLSGAGVSPTTASCGTTLTTTSLTSNGGTITATIQADNTYSRYRFNDSSTSKTFTGSGTTTFYQCYEVDDSYAMNVQSPPPNFNANYNALITGNLACATSSLSLFIPSNSIGVTSGFNWFDAGSITFPTTFTIGSPALTWLATPPSSNPVNNIALTTAGGQTFTMQYITAIYSPIVSISEQFHLQDLLRYTFSGGALLTPIQIAISEQFLLANSFFFSFVNSISVAEKFNFGNAFCIPPIPCNTLPPPTPSITVYVANDSPLDTLITEILYPIGIVLAVTIFAREWGKLNENSVLPISLFMVLMIAWAGQGNVFPSWVSLMIILIGAGGIAWRLGAYFINDRETPLESESDLGSY